MIDLDTVPCRLSPEEQRPLSIIARVTLQRARETLEIIDACAGDPNGCAHQVEVEITADYEEGV